MFIHYLCNWIQDQDQDEPYCPTKWEICLGLFNYAAATYRQKRHSPTTTTQEKEMHE